MLNEAVSPNKVSVLLASPWQLRWLTRTTVRAPHDERFMLARQQPLPCLCPQGRVREWTAWALLNRVPAAAVLAPRASQTMALPAFL
jgi:hypothetical protein